jgi:hypothetical protein
MRILVAVAVAASAAQTASAQEVVVKSADVSAAIDRGLSFLTKDALAWKAEHNCVSCHHAALVVWAMREAKEHGHAVDEPVLAELTKWMAESGDGKTGVPRPAGIPKALNTKAVYFALALQADPSPDALAQEALKRLLKTVQEALRLEPGGEERGEIRLADGAEEAPLIGGLAGLGEVQRLDCPCLLLRLGRELRRRRVLARLDLLEILQVGRRRVERQLVRQEVVARVAVGDIPNLAAAPERGHVVH